MKFRFFEFALAAVVAGSQLTPAVAEPVDPVATGKQIYEERCLICHGANGKGDGAVGEMFETRPGDLTTLQPEGQFFPYMDVLAKIDGREVVMGHGTEMPIWGEAFMVDALEDRGVNPKDAAAIVNARLASLLFYLATLQGQ
ncbi:c-type cytochrome [Marimonas arenosa]|uniref:Cytochrome c n=1 Tax=Marimonas arenosa TaxID=1795305 RepID=A0AAE4B4P5_9RHOB|nr:cytochrome c [Marimonas arenosa]MDQ2088296.1 cytochrome c [Marimonas arenosa]